MEDNRKLFEKNDRCDDLFYIQILDSVQRLSHTVLWFAPFGADSSDSRADVSTRVKSNLSVQCCDSSGKRKTEDLPHAYIVTRFLLSAVKYLFQDYRIADHRSPDDARRRSRGRGWGTS